jgi:hypothetical protein
MAAYTTDKAISLVAALVGNVEAWMRGLDETFNIDSRLDQSGLVITDEDLASSQVTRHITATDLERARNALDQIKLALNNTLPGETVKYGEVLELLRRS